MKYTAIISADEPLTEDIIQDLKDTMFFGDDPAYAFEIENIKLEQEPTTKNNLGVDCRSLEDIKKLVERKADALDGVMLDAGGVIIGLYFAIANDLTPVTPQEPKIKVLDNDEVARKLGTVDIYKASAWITLLKDLEYLGMKICEVEE